MSILDLKVRIGGNTKDFDSAMKKMQSSFGKSVRKMKRTGQSLTRNLTVPIVGLGAVVGKTAIEFETAFAGVRKTVDATASEFNALRTGIINMSKELPTSTTEIAAVAEAAGQLGVKTENILEFTKTMVMLGDTTNMAASEAATSLARIANIMQLPQDKFDEMGSTIVALGNNFATTEAEITDMSTRIAGAGKIANIAASDIFAISTALSSVGVRAESGGTAVQKGILAINDAVNRGGEELEVFADTAGRTTSEFQRAWKEDAGMAFADFVNGLGSQGGNATTTLEKVGLQSERTRKAFLSLAGAGTLLNDTIKEGRTAWTQNNALTKEAEQRYATMASNISEAFNSIKAVAISFEDIIKPAVNGFTDGVKRIAQVLYDLSDETKKRVLILAGLFAVGGPIITALGVLSAAFAAISGPVLAAVAVIGAASYAIIKHWDVVSDYFTTGEGYQLWISLKGVVEETINLLKSLWNEFGDELIAVTSFFMNRIGKTITHTLDQIKNAVKLWRNIIEGEFGGALSTISDMFTDWGVSMEDAAKDYSNLIWSAFKFVNPLRITFNVATGLFNTFFQETAAKAKTAGQNIGNNFNEGLKAALGKAPWQFGQQPFNFATAGTGTGGSSSGTGGSSSGINSFSDDFDIPKVGELFEFDWDSMKVNLQTLENSLKRLNAKFDATGDKASQMAQTIAQGISNMAGQFLEGVGRMMAGTDDIKGVFNNVLQTLAELAIRVGKIAIGVGTTIEAIKAALATLNPYVVIAAGAALIVLGSWARSSLQKAADNSGAKKSGVGVPRMATGGVIPSGFPNDTYPALLSSGETVIPAPNPLPASGSSQIIHNVVKLDSRVIYESIEKYKDRIR